MNSVATHPTTSSPSISPAPSHPLRLVIIGGVAGGASAAARARRLAESAQITIVERGPDVSFANCGLPYFIGGEITDRDRLAVQTPQSLAQLLNVEVKTRTEAISINREAKTLRVRNVQTGEEADLPYDKLILSPGASPLRPPLPGIEDPRILTLRNLQDMDRIREKAEAARRVLIVGAGFIGLEMAEQLQRLGKQVTLVELVGQVLPQLDAEMVKPIENELRENGVELRLGDGIKGFHSSESFLTAELNSGATVETDLVILSIGVKPENQLASEAGLELGQRGAMVVNEFQQTSDPDIYAAGDAVETADRVEGSRMVLQLGGPANRQGRTAADHIFMSRDENLPAPNPYPGSIGTAIVRVFDMAAGVTGWTERRLQQAEKAYDTVTVTDFNHAGYYPEATLVTVKVLWEKETGRLLGGQVYGPDGVDKRLDVLATAIAGRLTIDDLVHLELAYAPPFGSARDVLNTAGFAAQNKRDGLSLTLNAAPQDTQLIDVRPAAMAEVHPISAARNIPLTEIRERLDEIDKDQPVTTVCARGKMSYFASRILRQHGYQAHGLMGGLHIHTDLLRTSSNGSTSPDAQPSDHFPSKPSTPSPAPETMHTANPMSPVISAESIKLDCSGMACPGPLLRVREAIDGLAEGQTLQVTASDPGFSADIRAFAESAGYPEPAIRKEKGLIHASLQKTRVTQSVQSGNDSTPATANPDTTLVVFSQEMDKALAALVIANGAAAMGGKVTMFFTFWGLNVLRKEQSMSIKGKTAMDRMFGAMLPRGLGKLPLSNMNFGGMGRAMMVDRMKSKNLPNLPGLMAEAQQAGVRMVACTMSMEAMGIREEELIDGLELGGVADFMGASAKAGTNLFI